MIWRGERKRSSMVGLHKCVLDKGTNQGASHPAKLSFYYNEKLTYTNLQEYHPYCYGRSYYRNQLLYFTRPHLKYFITGRVI